MQIQSKHLLYFIVIVLCFSIIPSLDLIPLSSLNEGRRALVIDEMFSYQHWLLPSLNGDLYLSKPPLLYWLSLMTSNLMGHVSEFSIRLPSAIAGLLTLILTYRAGRQYFNTYVALLATILLAANLEFAMLARRAEIEMLLTLLCFASWLSVIQFVQTQQAKWQWLSFALLALAVMTKGPVAMLFITLPALIVAIIQRDKTMIAYLSHVRVWVMFFVLAGFWYWLVSMKLGFDIWSTVVQKDMLDKMQSEASAKPLLSYVGWALVDFYGLLLILLLRGKAIWQAIKQYQPACLLAVGALVPFVVFSLFANKHIKYLLPIYPILALLIAWQISELIRHARPIIAKLILISSIVVLTILTMFYLFFEAHYFDYRFSALRQFTSWYQPYRQQPIYALNQIDSRLVFYAKRPIPVVNKAQLAMLQQQHSSFILLNERKDKLADDVQAQCTMQTFKPYLKRAKALDVYGFGSICENKDKAR